MTRPAAALADDLLLRRGLKLAHLRLLALIAETGQLGQAAQRLAITQPAASRLLAEIERIAGQRVHERSGRGLVLTPAGRVLAHRARRVQIEMDAAGRELAGLGAGGLGHVRLGAVTGAALDLVLPALRAARLAHPDLTVEVEVQPSAELCGQLLAGRLDLVLGRLPQGPERPLLDLVPIRPEPVALVARRGHRLLAEGTLAAAALAGYDWVMPDLTSPLGRAVIERLDRLGVALGPVRVATSSFLLTLALVRATNAIAPLSLAVAQSFAQGPDAALAILPLDLGIVVPDYGLITRRDSLPTPAAVRLIGLIRAEAAGAPALGERALPGA